MFNCTVSLPVGQYELTRIDLKKVKDFSCHSSSRGNIKPIVPADDGGNDAIKVIQIKNDNHIQE